MGKSTKLKMMISPNLKRSNLNSANTSPCKRKKISEDNENLAESVSALTIELESPEFTESKTKRNLKGESSLKHSRAFLKKPKKNITAYAFFIKQKRKEFYKRNVSNVLATTMMKELGQQWSSMTDSEKQPFFELSEKDRLRYEEEVKVLSGK
mmetsp:Transcript_33841/g.39043  ORF Transcript_33841/g.39043 Transcript_33841/m.39043 type:complete len:153 (-) Transcript_33841:234-692(-)